MSGLAVQVENLTKSYGTVKAVAGISFEVRTGEIFGMVGPNGAGKSTTLSVLQGLRRADGGEVKVLGLDVRLHAVQIKQQIGVQLQRTSLLPDLTALAQVELLAGLYGRALSRREAMKLLERVSLAEKAGVPPGKLSGGQQQRLALALALVNDPLLIFLDEPTAGLDPQARRDVWNIFRQLHKEGRTIVMTTHYLEEAETLCQRVAVINHGKLLALDAPDELINRADGSSSLEDVYLQLTGREVRGT
ncbi:MAG TPA: ABC transporter ATP-binding protein [Blastocatellia bacterium]